MNIYRDSTRVITTTNMVNAYAYNSMIYLERLVYMDRVIKTSRCGSEAYDEAEDNP
jgi:hypothetical protein